jgi:hypothetical protein
MLMQMELELLQLLREPKGLPISQQWGEPHVGEQTGMTMAMMLL